MNIIKENQQKSRYSAHWGCDVKNQCTRYIVIVYDRFLSRVIYVSNVIDLVKEFNYIKNYYKDCDPPNQKGKPIDIRKYLD